MKRGTLELWIQSSKVPDFNFPNRNKRTRRQNPLRQQDPFTTHGTDEATNQFRPRLKPPGPTLFHHTGTNSLSPREGRLPFTTRGPTLFHYAMANSLSPREDRLSFFARTDPRFQTLDPKFQSSTFQLSDIPEAIWSFGSKAPKFQTSTL